MMNEITEKANPDEMSQVLEILKNIKMKSQNKWHDSPKSLVETNSD